MRFSHYLFLSFIQFGILTWAMLYSGNGLLDLFELQGQIRSSEQTISEIEEQNKELRRQLDVIEKFEEMALEDFARSEMGYAQEGERVYLQTH